MSNNDQEVLDLMKKYWYFSIDLEESDENVKKICEIIKSEKSESINNYYKSLIRYIVQQKNYKTTIPFFRIVTLNQIREIDNFIFTSNNEFSDYVDNFKTMLENEDFPLNIKNLVSKLRNIPSEEYNNQTFELNFDLIREYIKIRKESLNRQFANYGTFNYFRHLRIYYTEEGNNYNKNLRIMWENLYEFLLRILELSKEDFFLGSSSFFKGTERQETDYTWSGLVKREIGNIEIEEDKTKSLQLFFSISYQGIAIGTYLGANTTELLEGFLKANVDKNRDHVIKLLKFLQKKYGDHIKLTANDIIYDLEDNLDDISYQNSIIDLYKLSFNLRYFDFQGDLSEFKEIIVDFFKLYKLLTEEIIDYRDPEKILKDNLDDYDFLSYKNMILEDLGNSFIAIPLEKTIEKILKILGSGKHIILTGAPGTGKTMLLEKIFKMLKDNTEFIEEIIFTTATSDWSVFETIGGLIPYAGKLDFQPGIFLKCFKEKGQFTNKWLMIDELNRANIDKAFGSFFSLLSNQEVELPFKTIKGDILKVIPLARWKFDGFDKAQIIEKMSEESNFERFFISPLWRIGGTINSSDKASLHQLSHAFIRRFGFLHIPIPNVNQFMREYKFKCGVSEQNKIKIVWLSVNNYYEIGPAIIIDIDEFLKNSSFTITDAFEVFILPQIESLPDDIFNDMLEDLQKEFSGDEESKNYFNSLKITYL